MRAIRSKLKRKLKAADTEERCGLILKGGKVIDVPNLHADPTQGFRIDGAVMLEHEEKLVGTWHTHPKTPALLSQEDYTGFLNWPDLTHYIIGQDTIRAYKVEHGVIRECI